MFDFSSQDKPLEFDELNQRKGMPRLLVRRGVI
jgi:hypothetical protein